MPIDPNALYITDNGATLCGAHLGVTACLTGCDLSGQPVIPVTRTIIGMARAQGYAIACETCGKRATASARSRSYASHELR